MGQLFLQHLIELPLHRLVELPILILAVLFLFLHGQGLQGGGDDAHVLAEELVHHALRAEGGRRGHLFVHRLLDQLLVDRHLSHGLRAEHLAKDLHLALLVGRILLRGLPLVALPFRRIFRRFFGVLLRLLRNLSALLHGFLELL